MRYHWNKVLKLLRTAGLYNGPIHYVMRPAPIRLMSEMKPWN